MKIIICFALICLFSCSNECKPLYVIKSKDKPKVLILTNSNGGGHNSAATAVKNALENDYDIEIFDILKNKLFGERLFGYSSQKEYWFLLKYLLFAKNTVETINSFYYKDYIYKSIVKRNPDLLISVFPMGIDSYKKVADYLGIPFVLIPTDFNAYNLSFYRLNKFETDSNNKDRFRLFLPFETNQIKKSFEDSKIKDSIRYTGYPIRKDFVLFANEYRKNHSIADAIKTQENIEKNDKTILITVGAESWSEDSIIEYVNEINDSFDKIKLENKLHVYVACGKNKNLISVLGGIKIKNPDRLKIHLKTWISAEDMAKLMAISDVIIAKPGGSTVAEILAIGKNVIFKTDSTFAIPWEKDNMLLTEDYKLGYELSYRGFSFDTKDFIERVNNVLYLDNIEETKMPPINMFYINVKKEIDNLMNKV